MGFLDNQAKGFASALLYMVCSTSMAFINKAVLSSYKFDFPFVIMTLQMVFTIFVLDVLHRFNKIELPKLSKERCRGFFLPSICYALNAVLGLTALAGMNVPMYGVIKRCAPVILLIMGTSILKKPPPSRLIIVSVIMMTSGCIIAGYGDLSFNFWAYMCGGASNISQALYLILVEKFCEQKKSTVETLQLNSVNTLPILALFAVLKGELIGVFYFDQVSISFILLLCLVISMGCLLNYSLFLCTIMNCALTTSVAGITKSVVQTAVGLFTFGGISLNNFTVSGIVINLSGGAFYSLSKYMDYKNKEVNKESNSKHADHDDYKKNGTGNYLGKDVAVVIESNNELLDKHDRMLHDRSISLHDSDDE